MRDYSQPGDPYGISEYTEQSADSDVADRKPAATGDPRGNTVLNPRSVPTQEEADSARRQG